MTHFEEIMAKEEFVNTLENTASYEEFAEVFAKEGVNIEELMPSDSEELSEDDLVDVAGGVSAKDLKRIVKAAVKTVKSGPVKGAWRFGTSCGILLKAYYDIEKYGDATHTYSESQIMKAAKALGCA